MSFGHKLKELRTEKGLLQKELAEKLNLSQKTISNYEKDNRFPDQDTLVKIANYFNVSVDWLIGQTNVKNYYDFLADKVIELNNIQDIKWTFKKYIDLLKKNAPKSIDIYKSTFANILINSFNYDINEIKNLSIYELFDKMPIKFKKDFLATLTESFDETLLEKIGDTPIKNYSKLLDYKINNKQKLAEELIQILIDSGEITPNEEITDEKKERLLNILKKAIELSKL